MWKSITSPALNCPPILCPALPFFAMSKITTIQTIPPVNVKLWSHGSKHFWAYDYPGNSKNGPFKSEKLALLDATQFSSDS